MDLIFAILLLVSQAEFSQGQKQLPDIIIDEDLHKLIPPRLQPAASNLTSSIQTLDTALDLSALQPTLDSAGPAGPALLASLKTLITVLQTGKFGTTFEIGEFATKGHVAILEVQKDIAVTKAAASIQSPALDSLELAISDTEKLLKVLSCLNPFSCPLGMLNPRKFGRR